MRKIFTSITAFFFFVWGLALHLLGLIGHGEVAMKLPETLANFAEFLSRHQEIGWQIAPWALMILPLLFLAFLQWPRLFGVAQKQEASPSDSQKLASSNGGNANINAPDVWVYDAAHFIVTRDWKAEQRVGYGNEVSRLHIEGTTSFRQEVNVTTGENKLIRLTPEEEALAIRNSRMENVNNALKELREAAIKGLQIWSVQDSEKPPERISKPYWERYGFEEILDLKASSISPQNLRTANRTEPNNKPIYHSLKVNRKDIEMIWNSENTPRR